MLCSFKICNLCNI